MIVSIGQFSKLSTIPITTLRFWDKKGILIPAHVNQNSGYRYYDTEQLERIHTITALQRCGLCNTEIKRVITPGVNTEVYAMRIHELQRARRRLEEAIRHLNFYLEDTAGHSAVVLKSIPEMSYLSSRKKFADTQEMHREFAEIVDYIIKFRLNSQQPYQTIGVYHEEKLNKNTNYECECLVRVRSAPLGCPYTVKMIPAVETVATIIYIGAYDIPDHYYNLLTAWVEQNGYVICGPIRQWFVTDPYDGKTEEDRYVSELQVPIEKKY